MSVNNMLIVARRLATSVSHLSAVLAGLAFLALFIVNVAQMVMRTFAGGGWIWVTDLSQLLFIWMVMLGTVTAYHTREHIVVDFLVSRLDGIRELMVAIFVRTLEIGLFGFLLIAGYEVARNRAGIAYIQLGIPTSWAYAALPVAAILLIMIAVTLPLRFERELALDDIEAPDGSPTPGNPQSGLDP